MAHGMHPVVAEEKGEAGLFPEQELPIHAVLVKFSADVFGILATLFVALSQASSLETVLALLVDASSIRVLLIPIKISKRSNIRFFTSVIQEYIDHCFNLL